MRLVLVLAVGLSTMSTLALAQTASGRDHASHHPAGASSAPSKGSPSALGMSPRSSIADITAMKSMREMHEKMMAAKTAEQRQALMADHMKAMQDAMATMGQIKGGKTGKSSETMAMRMDMMEMMMQMMMDREAARVPVAK